MVQLTCSVNASGLHNDPKAGSEPKTGGQQEVACGAVRRFFFWFRSAFPSFWIRTSRWCICVTLSWSIFPEFLSCLHILTFISERQEPERRSFYFRSVGPASPSGSSAAAAAARAGNQLLADGPGGMLLDNRQRGSKQKAPPQTGLVNWRAWMAFGPLNARSSLWEVSASFKHSAVITPSGGCLITLVLM